MFSPITNKRKKKFCEEVMSLASTQIGFADVGSGGELKFPWNLLPSDKLNKFNFDPEEIRDAGKLPVCVSNKNGEAPFYIARDPRSSSLHLPENGFVERFDQKGILVSEEIRVMCATLDQIFTDRFHEVDLLDINVEGHDFQVLEGSSRLFAEGFLKCIKIEFELTQIWQGQGWFSDMDAFLRQHGYDLAFIDIEYSRPANVKSIYHAGEPLWGKAIYVPGMEYWRRMSGEMEDHALKEGALKSIVLYTVLDLPGRSLDLLNFLCEKQPVPLLQKEQMEKGVFAVYQYAKLDALVLRFGRKIPLLSRLIKWQ